MCHISTNGRPTPFGSESSVGRRLHFHAHQACRMWKAVTGMALHLGEWQAFLTAVLASQSYTAKSFIGNVGYRFV
jgi:hypothetical protein